ncbi:hypothetical protein, partial [Kosakonia cowanii]|uniref:hypothetical protein n=1 Tax=Kosakonia cowanii TaxID=208223 RepID=UPI003B20C15A
PAYGQPAQQPQQHYQQPAAQPVQPPAYGQPAQQPQQHYQQPAAQPVQPPELQACRDFHCSLFFIRQSVWTLQGMVL